MNFCNIITTPETEYFLSSLINITNGYICQFFTPQTLTNLHLINKNSNLALNEKIWANYGKKLRPQFIEHIGRLNTNWKTYFLQQLYFSTQNNEQFNWENIEIYFEFPKFNETLSMYFDSSGTGHQEKDCQDFKFWKKKIDTVIVSISYTPRPEPKWLRDDGKSIIRTFTLKKVPFFDENFQFIFLFGGEQFTFFAEPAHNTDDDTIFYCWGIKYCFDRDYESTLDEMEIEHFLNIFGLKDQKNMKCMSW